MTLDYQEKLRIFHDEFIRYSWKYIDLQKSLAARQVVPNYITSTQNQHGLTTKIPILGSVTDLALEFDSFFSNPFKIDLYKSIRKLFPGDSSEVQKTLSIAIQKIAVHTESYLNRLENEETISQLATAAVTKLIYYLNKKQVTQCTEADIVTGVLAQNSWFANDVFVAKSLKTLFQSEHYCLIKEDDLKAGSISTDIDSSEESSNSELSSALTEYIETQNPLIKEKQIIIYEESESILKFIAIGACKFETDLDNLQINYLKKSVSQLEKVVFNQKNSNPSDIDFDNIRGGIANFVGRKNELDNIQKYFERHDGAIQVIGGLGGMGKTQLVLNYVNQLKEDYYDYRVRWIEAGSQESLEKSFREFAEDLSIEILNCNFNKVRELVLKKLEKGVDKSLLVFDNALSKDLIKDYIPEFSKKKKHDIIITTQNVKDWEDSYSVKKCNIIKLEALSPEDASDLVKSVLGDVEKGDANKLANLFSCIPLGLTQSLAFIKFNKCGIKDYFDELKGTKKTLENSKTNTENSQTDSQLHSQNSQTDSQISALSYQSNSQFIPQLTEMVHLSLEDASHEHIPNIYTTLKITLDIIKQEFPSAYKIVKLCSYLNADSIPFELFNHFFQKIRDKNYATSVLEGYSLLSVSEKNNDQFLDIHRIVQQIIIHETPLAQRSDDIIELAEHIVEQKLFTRDNIVKEKYQNNIKFLLHIESLIRKAKKYSIELNSELVFLELATAVYHDFNGDHQKAIKKLSILKKSIEELVGDSSDLTIIIQNLAEKSSKLPTLYAQIYYHLGKANLSIYLKKITDLNNLNNNFNKLNQDSLGDLTKAIKIREIIDNNSEFDESYNSGSAERPMDTIIFERQGILFWHKSQNTINGLLEALKGYEKLINFEKNLPENLRDKFNLDTCRRLYIECSVEMPNFKSDFTNLLKMVGENLSINYGDLDSISEREKFAEQIYQTLESKVNEYFRIAREFNLIGKIFIKIYDFSKSIKDLDLARKFIQKAKALEESNGLQNFIFEDANKLLEQLSLSESSANHNKKITDLDHSVSISLESFANNFLELKKILDSCKQDDENNNSGEKNSKLDDLVNQLKDKSARFLENLDNQQNEVADEIVINSAINLDENSASDVPANNDAALDLINQQNLLLERINKIKEIVGEQSINKYSGFYNYIYNALSHNLFSNSAKQIIDIINKLVESLENVINWSISTSQENTEVADYGSHLWVQLEYLLEFTASGQKFIGFSGRRAPGIGPDEGDGGGYYGSGYYQESDRNGAHQDQGDSLSVDYCNNGTSIDSSIGTLSNTTIAETRGLKSFGSESLLNFEAEI